MFFKKETRRAEKARARATKRSVDSVAQQRWTVYCDALIAGALERSRVPAVVLVRNVPEGRVRDFPARRGVFPETRVFLWFSRKRKAARKRLDLSRITRDLRREGWDATRGIPNASFDV